MDHNPQTNSVEQRRKLLKGALATSGVWTMGYSGAALASITCAEKGFVDGGYPTGTAQFFLGDNPPEAYKKYAWQEVAVKRYTTGSTEFDGFTVNNTLYSTSAPETPATGVLVDPQPAAKKGWVLAYFYFADGKPNGVYPSPYATADRDRTPATGTCLVSITPGLKKTRTMGG